MQISISEYLNKFSYLYQLFNVLISKCQWIILCKFIKRKRNPCGEDTVERGNNSRFCQFFSRKYFFKRINDILYSLHLFFVVVYIIKQEYTLITWQVGVNKIQTNHEMDAVNRNSVVWLVEQIKLIKGRIYSFVGFFGRGVVKLLN